MYRQAMQELMELKKTNPELAEKVASSILENMEKTAEFKPGVLRSNPEFQEAGGLSGGEYLKKYILPAFGLMAGGAGLGAGAGAGISALKHGSPATGATLGLLLGSMGGGLATIPLSIDASRSDSEAWKQMIINRIPPEEWEAMDEDTQKSILRKGKWLGILPDKRPASNESIIQEASLLTVALEKIAAENPELAEKVATDVLGEMQKLAAEQFVQNFSDAILDKLAADARLEELIKVASAEDPNFLDRLTGNVKFENGDKNLMDDHGYDLLSRLIVQGPLNAAAASTGKPGLANLARTAPKVISVGRGATAAHANDTPYHFSDAFLNLMFPILSTGETRAKKHLRRDEEAFERAGKREED